MSLFLHPDSRQLQQNLNRCLALAKSLEGSIFRFTPIRFSNRVDLLSGAGARLHGGRWNPVGKFNCVYGSLTAGVAQDEAFANFDRYGIPRNKMRPLVQVAIHLRLQFVLDLTDVHVLKSLDITVKQLTDCDWETSQGEGKEALTQAIGRICHHAELEAIIVPSRSLPKAKNIALFPGRRRVGSSWKIQGARDLPGRHSP